VNEQAKNITLPGLPAPAPQASGGMPSLGVPLVFVTGGKGGVGKSSLALNLALELGKRGRRVLLVDLDLGLGNLAVMLKLSVRRSVEDFLEGTAPVGDCLTSLSTGSAGPGCVDLFAGAAGSGELARPDSARRARLFDGLREAARAYDVVLADGAAGIGPDVLAFAGAADLVLAVATPEPASVTDVYGILKALDTWSREQGVEVPTPGLVFNRVSGPSEANALLARLGSVTRRFLSRNPRLVGWIPESRSVREAVLAQRPFVQSEPRALAAQCVARLAARLEGLVGIDSAKLTG
jgi:flagellar biosynthesis protein FlhG